MPSPSHETLLRAILERSSTDREFRRLLLSEPRPVIQREFGVAIPRNFNIRFIEKESGTDALVVLPDVVSGGGELSDDDLDAVAGGTEGPEWDSEQ